MSLDEELERAAASLNRIEVEPPDLDQARRRRRRSRQWLSAGAVVGVVAVVAGAVVLLDTRGESQQVTVEPPTTLAAESPQVTVVPWVDVPTTTFVEPTMPAVPATAPPCRSKDIEVEVGSPTRYLESPAVRLLQFTNVGRGACSLAGRPSVTAIADDGHGTVIAAPADLMPEIAGPVVEVDVLPVGTHSIAPLWTAAACAETPERDAPRGLVRRHTDHRDGRSVRGRDGSGGTRRLQRSEWAAGTDRLRPADRRVLGRPGRTFLRDADESPRVPPRQRPRGPRRRNPRGHAHRPEHHTAPDPAHSLPDLSGLAAVATRRAGDVGAGPARRPAPVRGGRFDRAGDECRLRVRGRRSSHRSPGSAYVFLTADTTYQGPGANPVTILPA